MDENKNPAEEAKKAWEAMQKNAEAFKERRKTGRGGNFAPNLDGKKTGRLAVLVVLGILIAVTIFSAFYKVSEQEQAIVTTFGRVTDIRGAGLYFKIPFVQNVTKVDTTTHGMPIGYRSSDDPYNAYGAYEDDEDAYMGYEVVEDGYGSGRAYNTVEHESIMITKDFNFVDVDFYLEYRVSDPVKYLYASSDPRQILRNLAMACIRSTVINYNVDDVITTAKSQIQAEVREKLEKELSTNDIGLQVVNLTVQDAEPPTDNVMTAFKAVETAKQGKETTVNNAKRYRSEQIPEAEAEADRITQEAEAKKEARIAEAEGQTARFEKLYEEYVKNPLITRQRMFYEALEEILPRLKVVISDGDLKAYMQIDENEQASGSVAVREEAAADVPTEAE